MVLLARGSEANKKRPGKGRQHTLAKESSTELLGNRNHLRWTVVCQTLFPLGCVIQRGISLSPQQETKVPTGMVNRERLAASCCVQYLCGTEHSVVSDVGNLILSLK